MPLATPALFLEYEDVLKRPEQRAASGLSVATYPLKLPASIKKAAVRLAREDGVSLNQWISSAAAQKIGAVETAAAFFSGRAGGARPEDLHAVLALAPDRKPALGDEVPDGA